MLCALISEPCQAPLALGFTREWLPQQGGLRLIEQAQCFLGR